VDVVEDDTVAVGAGACDVVDYVACFV
jgi:hypothetical protein